MKLRSFVPALALVLLTGSLAYAAPLPDLQSVLSADLSTEAPANCPDPASPFTAPAGTEKSTYPACGACSVTVCQGAEEETVCGFKNGQFLYCRPTGPLCQDGGPPYVDFRCTCTSNIIP